MSLQRQFAFDAPLSPDPLSPRSDLRPVRPARKIVRTVCRENANRLRDEAKKDRSEGKETKEQKVLRCLAAFFNHYAYWPTAHELTYWMAAPDRKEIPAPNINLVAPKLTIGLNGDLVTEHGVKVRKRGGLYETLPLRTCRITGGQAHPYKIREVGSKETR